MATATLNLSGNGATYKRVSTDLQDAKRQQDTLTRWLQSNGATVDPAYVFADEGNTRADAANRPDWQRLLRLVDAGKVQWIAVDVQDRCESRDKYETAATIHRLRLAKCRLYTCDGREVTAGDIGSFLQTGLASETSEKEVQSKSERALEGKQLLARQGQWQGGKVPYAMDVVAVRLDAAGDPVEQWRVQVEGFNGHVKTVKSNGQIKKQQNVLRVKISRDGQRARYDGPNNFPAADKDDILQLRPTLDTTKLDVVRMIFNRMANEKIKPSTLARQLNTQGIAPPPNSAHWHAITVRDLLTNSIYIGRPAWNRYSSGTYGEFVDGARQVKERDAKPKRHARKDWIMSERELFDPIVNPELWQQVQTKVDALPKAKRASVNGGYIFAGLVVCANCSGNMVGSRLNRKDKPRDTWPLTYLCSSYNAWKGERDKCPCKAYRVHQTQLVEVIQDYLGQTLPTIDEIAGSVRGRAPERARAALVASMRAYTEMRTRVLSDPQYRAAMEEVPDSLYEAALETLYRRWFRLGSQQAQARLDQLETEHSQTVASWQAAPTPRSKAKLAARMSELEAEIEELEHQTRNAADQYQQANAECAELWANWQGATEALAGDMASRSQAEAVAKVIAQVRVTFAPTGLACPVGRVAAIEVIPVDPHGGILANAGLRESKSLTPSP